MNLQQLANIGLGAIFPIQLTTPKDSEGEDQYVSELVDPINFTLTPSSLRSALISQGYTDLGYGINLTSEVRINEYILLKATPSYPILITSTNIILIGGGNHNYIQIDVPTGGTMNINITSGDIHFSSDNFNVDYDITPSNIQARLRAEIGNGNNVNYYLTLASDTSGTLDRNLAEAYPIRFYLSTDSGTSMRITNLQWNGNKTESKKVKKLGWYPGTGLDLIKNNLTSVFIYQIGERFRQENFGSRLWECIEEPNTQLLSYMATKFIKESIAQWESRIKGLKVECTRENSKLYIKITFAVDTSAAAEAILEYDNSTNTSYAY